MADEDPKIQAWWRERSHKDWAYTYADERRPTEISFLGKLTREREEGTPFEHGESDNTDLNDFIRAKKLKWIPYDEFEEVKYLTSGGFGEIHVGLWSDKKKRVALKSLSVKEKNLQKFLQEWEYHESCLFSYEIVDFYGFTKGPDGYMAVMEYANKGTLKTNLKKISKSGWREKLYVLYKISSGLYLMHAKNLIHRDLHHGNILINIKNENDLDKFVLDKDDDVWISDLGLCKSINSLLKDEEVYANMPFLAPEVMSGNPYEKASDVYCFALIMWELISGDIPYENELANLGLSADICQGIRPDIKKNTPKCYADLMKKCWDTDPSKRLSSDAVNRLIMKWIIPPKEITNELDDIREFIKADEDAANDNNTEQTSLPSNDDNNTDLPSNDDNNTEQTSYSSSVVINITSGVQSSLHSTDEYCNIDNKDK